MDFEYLADFASSLLKDVYNRGANEALERAAVLCETCDTLTGKYTVAILIRQLKDEYK